MGGASAPGPEGAGWVPAAACAVPRSSGDRGSSARQATQLVTSGVEWSNHAVLLLATDLAMVEAPGQTLSPL